MASRKSIAFALGAVVLLQGAVGVNGDVQPTGVPKTEDVLEAFNLFRNARIDGGLQNLTKDGGFNYDRTVTTFVTASTTTTTNPPGTEINACAKELINNTQGLLIELTADEATNFDIKQLLDKQLNDGLDKLIAQTEAAQPTYSNYPERNLAYLSTAQATGVPKNPTVSKEFAQALKARKAVVSISKLTKQDAGTPLHQSRAANVSLSALVTLGAALSMVLF